MMKKIYTEKGIEIGKKSGLSEGEIFGEIKTMFKRMHMTVEEISKELKLDVEYVKGVIETI